MQAVNIHICYHAKGVEYQGAQTVQPEECRNRIAVRQSHAVIAFAQGPHVHFCSREDGVEYHWAQIIMKPVSCYNCDDGCPAVRRSPAVDMRRSGVREQQTHTTFVMRVAFNIYEGAQLVKGFVDMLSPSCSAVRQPPNVDMLPSGHAAVGFVRAAYSRTL